MRAFLKVCIDEYRSVFTDAGGMLLFFGAIIVYPFFYPLPYLHEVLEKVPVAVVDLDHTSLSRTLVRMLDAGEYVSVASRPASLSEAEQELLSRKVSGIVVISNDFERRVLRGKRASVSLYTDGSYFLAYRQVMTGATQTIRTLSAGIEIRRLEARGCSLSQAEAAYAPLRALSYPLFNPAGGYATYVVMVVFIVLLQQTLLMGIGMLAGTRRERHPGSPPLTPLPLSGTIRCILGKGTAYLSIYLVHAVYLFFLMPRIYALPARGNPIHLFVFLLPFFLATIFLGIAVSHLFRSRETAILAWAFVSIPAVFLSGFSWPLEAIPSWLRGISLLLPSTAGIQGFVKIEQMGATLAQAGSEWGVLWILSLLYFLLACLCVRREGANLSPAENV